VTLVAWPARTFENQPQFRHQLLLGNNVVFLPHFFSPVRRHRPNPPGTRRTPVSQLGPPPLPTPILELDRGTTGHPQVRNDRASCDHSLFSATAPPFPTCTTTLFGPILTVLRIARCCRPWYLRNFDPPNRLDPELRALCPIRPLSSVYAHCD